MSRSIDSVRAGIVGRNARIEGPFGPRPLVYADFVASGRGLEEIDREIAQLQANYANPHTEDSALARRTRAAMAAAERNIRAALNAGPEDVLLPCGAGASEAVYRLQQILGLACPPASRAFLNEAARAAGVSEALEAEIARRRPVVFVGPYEHHSNELSWRESVAEVVRIGLDASGGLDFDHLARALKRPEFDGRRKIGAFSAASNVTGLKTDTVRLARLLHAHDAIFCLDAAASAPYQAIDMHPAGDRDARVDAVYFSPHKFLGGPGACGILLFDGALYRRDLAPTISGGGTVRYVTRHAHDFIEAIEPRERAGTPGVLQLIRAARALSLIADVGYDTIERREQAWLKRAFARWGASRRLERVARQRPFVGVAAAGGADDARRRLVAAGRAALEALLDEAADGGSARGASARDDAGPDSTHDDDAAEGLSAGDAAPAERGGEDGA